MAAWYLGSTKHTAITQWAATTAYVVGDIRRQLAAPAAGSERAFRCTTAGTSGAVEPTWTLTVGATTADGTAVWTEVTGNSTYGWSAAHARLRNALASGWAAAGDTVYVSHASAATEAAAVPITSLGTAASPINIICVNDAGSVPPVHADLATTATETGNSIGTIAFAGYAYCYGLSFIAPFNSGANDISFTSGSAWAWTMENCQLKLTGIHVAQNIIVGATGGGVRSNLLTLIGTSVEFGNVGQSVLMQGGQLLWESKSAAITGATFPTALFTTGGTAVGAVTISGVDLSALGSGKSLVTVSGDTFTSFVFENCKLGASVGITTGANVGTGGITVDLINCDSADTNYRYQRHEYHGNIYQEATTVRTGGATDGTTPFSRKMVSSPDARFYWPLAAKCVEYWNETLGAITITVEVVTDNVTLTDADAWLEIEYLGTTGFPLSVFASDRAGSILSTPANQTTSTVAWNTSLLTTPVKQKFEVTFTPAEKGLIKARVMLAKASTTLYFDPLILTSSGRQFMIGPTGIVNEAVQTGGGGLLTNPGMAGGMRG